MTLEEETGTANLIVWPDVWERHHAVARGAQVLLARGRLQRQGVVTHLVVEALEDASPLLPGTEFRSRDFH
jgi:error-prone DNA polymerase